MTVSAKCVERDDSEFRLDARGKSDDETSWLVILEVFNKLKRPPDGISL